MKKIYTTMQGRQIDMDALRAKNETTAAVGNVRMNARGDELGPGGTVIRKREDASAEYYEDNPNAQPQQTETVVPKPTHQEVTTSKGKKGRDNEQN
jgi:hypothetical protein